MLRRLAILGTLALGLVTGCERHRCQTNAHCLGSRICDDGMCVSPSYCGGDVPCFLASISPEWAATGETIELEGNFDPNATISFYPQSTPTKPVWLSKHRLSVVMPVDAINGVVSVSGVASGVAFRHVQYTPRISGAGARPQPVGVRQASRLAAPRSGQCMTLSAHVVFAIGGKDAAGHALGTVERVAANVDGSLGIFYADTPLLGTARSEAACVEVGSTLYVIGGFDSDGNALDTIEQTTINGFGRITDFQMVPQRLKTARGRASAAVVGNMLYVLGGQDQGGEVLDTIERARITSLNTLGEMVPHEVKLRTPRADAQLAISNGGLYLVGGADASGALTSVERAPLRDSYVHAFERVTDLKEPRQRAASTLLGHTFYVFGGEHNGVKTSTIESAVLDDKLTTTGFTELSPGLAEAGSGAVAVRWGNYVHLVGGSYATTQSVSMDADATINAFSTLTTNTIPNLPISKRFADGFVNIGRYVYFLGGRTITTSLQDIYVSQLSFGDLIPVPSNPNGISNASLLVPRSDMTTAVTTGNWLYVIGGQAGGVPVTTIERASIDTDGHLLNGQVGSLSVFPGQLQHPRWYHASVIVGDMLYIMGGRDQSGVLDSIEHATILPNGDLSGFTEDTIKLSSPRLVPTVAALGNRIYVIGGGVNVAGDPLSTVDIFSRSTDGKLTLIEPGTIPLNTARWAASSLFFDNRLFLLGGIATGSLSSVEWAQINDDGTLGGWSTSSARKPAFPPLGMGRNEGNAIIVQNQIYVFSGIRNLVLIEDTDRASIGSPSSPTH